MNFKTRDFFVNTHIRRWITIW